MDKKSDDKTDKKNVNNLPRGLISKNGVPLAPNQRLPSLKSTFESKLVPKSPVSLKTSLTRGGALKRIFKPNTKRKSADNLTKVSTPDAIIARSPLANDKFSIKKPKRFINNKQSKKREFIQSESTVFTGQAVELELLNKPPPKEPTRTEEIIPPKIELEGIQRSLSEDEVMRLFSEDLIGDSKQEVHEYLPLKIERYQRQTESKKTVEPNIFFNTRRKDSFILFQMPFKFGQNVRFGGRIGKIFVRKSGKVEFHDEMGNFSYDIAIPDDCRDEMSQEIISYQKGELTCLGSLSESNIMVMMSKTPLPST